MNRSRKIQTDDPAIKILDTIIRFPDEMEDVMTPEARAIRQKLTALYPIARIQPTQIEVINLIKGRGWSPLTDETRAKMSAIFKGQNRYMRSYTNALTRIGEYLEQTGELYEGMVVA